MPCVYALTSSASVGEVRYIGISREDTPDSRLKQHLRLDKRTAHLPSHKWVKAHLERGHSITATLLHQVETWEEACSLEIALIAEYRETGADLMNVTSGGDGAYGLILSEKTRQKISEARTGVKASDETRRKISEGHKGLKFSEEHKQKIGEANRRRVFTEEMRKNYSDGQKKKAPMSEETKRKLSEANSRRVWTDEARAKLAESARVREQRKREHRQQGI